MEPCPTGECKNHGHRILSLEERMERVENNQRDPRIWVAVFGLVGVGLSTAGSVFGVIISAWAKSNGWL